MEQVFDVAIVGGGINGCGCAADAALRGLSVILIEQDDIASKTSSKSTKLIHGGLRYLENYDFSLVKKALDERQKLLQIAPHLVHPLGLILPHQKNMRPLWLLRIGLFFYDYLSRINKLPHSTLVGRRKHTNYFSPLSKSFDSGFLFYDATADDARLTLENALQAKLHGATIMPHTKLIKAQVIDQQWQLSLQPKDGSFRQIKAKTIINTAGPWVEAVNQLLSIPSAYPMALVKGSHIIVEKLYEGEHAYMLQHSDKRIVFVIPYHDHTLIGTTDVPFSGALDEINIDENEINYLCTLVNQYFNKQISNSDIIDTWSGIRPLLSETDKSASSLSRDYAYHYVNAPAPAVSVYGGKITTYRQLASQVVSELHEIFPNLPHSSTESTPLPGAWTSNMSFSEYQHYVYHKYTWLEERTKERYLNTYGTRMDLILAGRNDIASLGRYFAPTLYQVEIDYLIDNEWAISSEDILWRRTKLGLVINAQEQAALGDYLLERTRISDYET